MSETEIARIENQQLAANQYKEVSVLEVRQRRQKIVELMQSSMAENVDYGIIPGCVKPTLLQPGAQKLLNMFHLDPEFARESDSVMDKDFILHSYKCTIYHIPTNLRVASGVGSCNSREDKYGMRTANRKCPQCSKETIIPGKEEYGGGFLCFKKKGGCGAKFDKDDPAITSQSAGKVPNENIYEQENTIRKMAQKRALIAACLNATGASDIFTQDVEDMPEFGGAVEADAKPSHREGNEHRTDFCKECQALGLPANCYAIMKNNCFYLRDINKNPLDHDKFCPNPKCIATRGVIDMQPEPKEQEPDWSAIPPLEELPTKPLPKPAPNPVSSPVQQASEGEVDYSKDEAPWCGDHNSPMKLVKAGVSKASGKPYAAFWACSSRGCKKSINAKQHHKELASSAPVQQREWPDKSPITNEDIPF